MNVTTRFSAWAYDSLALACIFSWIRLYPLHSPLLHPVFGPGAEATVKFFCLGHGLGLLAFAFLPPSLFGKALLLKGSGAAVFIASGVWTFIPPATLLHYWTSGLLGFISAHLVLAWIPRFMEPHSPVLKVGFAMALTYFLLGLSGFVLAQGLSAPFVKAAALFIGLGPLGAACLLARKTTDTPISNYPAAGKTGRQNIGAAPVLAIAAFAAAAYFTGGLWYKAVAPLLHLRLPALAGISPFLDVAAVLVFIAFCYRYSYRWLGPLSLSFLGIGVTVSLMGLDRVEALITTLLFLSLGFAAMDLFYWLALRTLARFLGFSQAFGPGLGVSLFFITVPGIALHTGLLIDYFPISPLAVVSALCLLFAVAPLLVCFFHPLIIDGIDDIAKDSRHTPETTAAAAILDIPDSRQQPPQFWFNLTHQEKKVYDLISQGYTDADVAEMLYITRHTVKFHTRNILRKAGVTNRKKLPAIDR